MAFTMSRAEMERVVTMRAWEDESFMKRLLEDPKAAIAEALKVQFEDDAEVVVHQEVPNSLHVVLPVKPAVLPARGKPMTVVKDGAGVYYEVPTGVLTEYAIRDATRMELAAVAWERKEPDVEAQGILDDDTWQRAGAHGCCSNCCGIRG